MKNMMNKGKEVAGNVRRELAEFWKNEDAMGSVEVILIVVVLVGLVLIFRTQVTALITNAFKQIKSDEGQIDTSNSISGAY